MSLTPPGGNRPGWGSSSSRRRSPNGHGPGSGGFNNNSGFGSGSGNRRFRSPGGGGAADSNSNPLVALWNAYNQSLESNPLITKAMTSLVGFLLGDLIAQKFLGGKDADLEVARLARMASFGFLIHGPVGHYFYGMLDRLIVGKSPLKVASKVVVDQVFWAPIFTAVFFAYLGFAERKTMDDIVTKIKNDTWTGVTASWKFWPFAHVINFALIPTSQRLLYINTLQVGYNVFLSFLGNK